MRIAILVGGRVAPPGNRGNCGRARLCRGGLREMAKAIYVVMVRGHFGEQILPEADPTLRRKSRGACVICNLGLE